MEVIAIAKYSTSEQSVKLSTAKNKVRECALREVQVCEQRDAVRRAVVWMSMHAHNW